MPFAARILLCADDADARTQISSILEAADFHFQVAASNDEALDLAAQNIPPITVVCADNDAGAALDLVGRLGRPHGNGAVAGSPSVIFVAPEGASDLQGPAFEAGADAFLDAPVGELQLTRRLELLGRLATMRAELRRRYATSERYGIDSPNFQPAEQAAGGKLLLVGADNPECIGTEKVLADTYDVTKLGEPAEVTAHLGRDKVDALLVELRRADCAPYLEMVEGIRRDTRNYNLPILIVADPSALGDPAVLFAKGATDLLTHPVSPKQLLMRTEALVQQQRVRLAMQRIYREAPHLVTSDSLTGLYSFGFLHEHLGAEIADAAARKGDLAVGVFDVRDMAEINEQQGYAAGDRLLRQLGGLVAALVRGEDLAARSGGEELCVVMPDTPLAQADFVTNRIASVINQTEFAVAEGEKPIQIHVDLGCASLADGDTPESLLARAHGALGS